MTGHLKSQSKIAPDFRPSSLAKPSISCSEIRSLAGCSDGQVINFGQESS
jgi:hypothetical protein